jgi:rubrerythrin
MVKYDRGRNKMAVFEAAQALEMAMRIEVNGEAFYRAVSKKTDDAELKELFEELASQERGHYRVFQRMAEEVESAPELPEQVAGDYQAFLEVALDQAVFGGEDKALRIAERAGDREAALRAAMGLEKDTMLFYYDLREMVGESDREAISAIIREEKKHLARLAGMV